ncbi:hypothetical protein NSERUTF1_6661 [Nocardia seriolae]|nr:hypothetical protein NSERUTF1_6661 [Nocardia seriolae]
MPSGIARHPGARCRTSVLPGGCFHLYCASRGPVILSRKGGHRTTGDRE